MIRLIINADDLGAGESNNREIFKLMSQGKVTSATVMVNGLAFEDAVARMAEFPQCSFGVHLDLNEFDYLTRDQVFIDNGIIDADGHVIANIRRKFLWPSRRLLDAVYAEWSAQMEKAIDAGVPVSHIDSHRHSHTLRIFAPLLPRLCEKYGVKRMRTKNQDFRYSSDRPLLRRFWRDAKRRMWVNRMSRHLIAPDHFEEATAGIRNLARHEIKRDLVIEWMCHPGNSHYPHDAAKLAENWEKTILSPFKLISYNDL